MLGEQQLLQYLLERELVSPQAVVADAITITNVSSRNRNFRIFVDDGRSFIAKQNEQEANGIGTLGHESAIYELLAHRSAEAFDPAFIPRFFGFDSDQNLLLLELNAKAENLRQIHYRRRRFSTLLARRAGQGLGQLHNVPISSVTTQIEGRCDPLALKLGLPGSSILSQLSGANLGLLRLIQKYPALCQNLADLQNSWVETALIHSDFKWDNCIAFAAPGSERKTKIQIVDWEFAGLGDPLWDVGAVFGDYFGTWLTSMPLLDGNPPERWVDLAAFPLEQMHPAINAFWTAYSAQREFSHVEAEECLIKSVRYSAGRLLESSYEQMQQSATINSYVYCHLQLALNLMERPAEAAVHLLGIPFNGSPKQ